MPTPTSQQQALALNQHTYQQLKLALSLHLRRQLFLAVCDNTNLRNQLAVQLHKELTSPVQNTDPLLPNPASLGPLPLGFGQPSPDPTPPGQLVSLMLDFNDPNPVGQIAAWLQENPQIGLGGQGMLGFQILGVEHLTREAPAVQRLFLSYLRTIERNLPRLNCSVLIWVNRPWGYMIRQSAPECWNWCTGVFEFVGDPVPLLSPLFESDSEPEEALVVSPNPSLPQNTSGSPVTTTASDASTSPQPYGNLLDILSEDLAQLGQQQLEQQLEQQQLEQQQLEQQQLEQWAQSGELSLDQSQSLTQRDFGVDQALEDLELVDLPDDLPYEFDDFSDQVSSFPLAPVPAPENFQQASFPANDFPDDNNSHGNFPDDNNDNNLKLSNQNQGNQGDAAAGIDLSVDLPDLDLDLALQPDFPLGLEQAEELPTDDHQLDGHQSSNNQSSNNQSSNNQSSNNQSSNNQSSDNQFINPPEPDPKHNFGHESGHDRSPRLSVQPASGNGSAAQASIVAVQVHPAPAQSTATQSTATQSTATQSTATQSVLTQATRAQEPNSPANQPQSPVALLQPTPNPESELDLLQGRIEQLRSQKAPLSTLAEAHLNLGRYYRNRIESGDLAQPILEGGISAYEQVLEWLCFSEVSPEEIGDVAWSDILNDLGTLYWMASRSPALLEKGSTYLQQAVQAYQLGLKKISEESSPRSYAMLQNNLGTVYSDLAHYTDTLRNLELAIAAYRAALRHRRPDTSPLKFAATQNNLGTAYWHLAQHQQSAENLQQAIAAYNQALRYYRPDQEPVSYAMIQNNLGTAYWNLSQYLNQSEQTIPGSEEVKSEDWLLLAVNAYQCALRFRTLETSPAGFAATQNNLGTAYWHLAHHSRDNHPTMAQYLQMSIKAYEAALQAAEQLNYRNQATMLSFDLFATHNNLGLAYYEVATDTVPDESAGATENHLTAALNHHLQALLGWKHQPNFASTAMNYVVQTVRQFYDQWGTSGQNRALALIPGYLLPEVLGRL